MGRIWYGEIKWKRLERRKSETVFKHLCSEVSRHLWKYLLHRNPHILNPARFLSHRSHLFPVSKHKMLISISTTEVMPVSPTWFIFQITKKIKKRYHQHPKGPLSLRNPAKSKTPIYAVYKRPTSDLGPHTDWEWGDGKRYSMQMEIKRKLE